MTSEFHALIDGVLKSLLPEDTQKKYNEMDQWLTLINNWLAHRQRYNTAFVERQRRRSQNLFENIGDSEIDLDFEQQHAVIRNDTYNQVIASAGTGKTVVLVTRIVYLIREQMVDPQEIVVFVYTREAKKRSIQSS